MTLKERIGAFHYLGGLLDNYLQSVQQNNSFTEGISESDEDRQLKSALGKINSIIKEACLINPWFTKQNIFFSLQEISRLLKEENLLKWLAAYPSNVLEPAIPKNVGVVLAGNLPLVGFHDFLCVLISGHRFTGKLSSKDDRLLPLIGNLLTEINRGFGEMITFEKEKITGMDAIIATGSNTTFRYFEYYFGKYPHIFRKNRNGVSVLNGSESLAQLTALSEDIFTYFGLGCRSIAKLFIPEQYNFDRFFKAAENYKFLSHHNKYMNNYTYFKSVFLLNKIPFLDNGFLILKQDNGYHSPIACLYYDHYHSPDSIARKLTADKDHIQCIVGEALPGLKTIPAGQAQHPELWDYADRIDTIDFLINLCNKKRR